MVQAPIANPTSAAAKDRLPQPPFPFLSGAALFCVAFFFLPSRSGLTPHCSLSFSTSLLLAPLSSPSPLTRSIIVILPSVLNHSRVICLPFASPSSSPPFLAHSPFSPSLPRYGKGLISAYPLLAPLPPSSTQGNTYSTSSCHTHFVCTVSMARGAISLDSPFFIQAAFSLYRTTHLHHYPMQAAFHFFHANLPGYPKDVEVFE